MFKLQEYTKSDYWVFALTVSNPGEYYDKGDHRTNYCNLHFGLFGHSWWFKIPQLFKPRKKWVDTTRYDWSKNSNGGFWEHIQRRYGISITSDTIHIAYGIQPGGWHRDDPENSDHTKVFWIPWKNMTYHHEELFTPDWESYAILHEPAKRVPFKHRQEVHELHRRIKEKVPKIKFKFNDYDGEEIIATCYISKRMWRHGISWCKWLGYIRKPLVKYALDLEFSKETGYNKGSWKGGTIGHSVEMEYGESPIEAFKRYGSAEDRYREYGTKNRGFTNIEVWSDNEYKH